MKDNAEEIVRRFYETKGWKSVDGVTEDARLYEAREKLGEHGVYLHGSFFDIHFDNDFFDCSISLHTIYHIDRDRQEEAVRKLIHVT